MMSEIDIEEKRNKRAGLMTTIGFHVVLLILFFFLLAWSEPDPPIPEFGIELSFVQSNSTGKVESEQQEQSQQESTDSKDEAQEPLEEELIEEAVEEQIEEEVVEDSEPVENTEEVEEVVEEVPIEEVSEPTEESEKIETEDVDSPDVVEEKKEETKVEEEKSKAKPTETTTTKGSGESNSENKPAPKPAIDSRAIYKGSKGSTNAQSSSGGSSLNMSGWIWDFDPEPDDNSDESGKIIFKITVDDEGEILRVTTVEKTVSPVVEKKYKDAVMDLTFSKTAENRSTATTSSGIITFIIKSR